MTTSKHVNHVLRTKQYFGLAVTATTKDKQSWYGLCVQHLQR